MNKRNPVHYARLAACCAVPLLAGCAAAVPLAQMALTSATAPEAPASTQAAGRQPCAPATGCDVAPTPVSFQTVSKQFGGAVRNWFGASTDAPSQTATMPPGITPPK